MDVIIRVNALGKIEAKLSSNIIINPSSVRLVLLKKQVLELLVDMRRPG
jgi:hypothetical protein